jgi:hypothetical protein
VESKYVECLPAEALHAGQASSLKVGSEFNIQLPVEFVK